jgi:NAD(P)-dependent dehydrogenase (short-subunit alcohol dehydrogenase family)
MSKPEVVVVTGASAGVGRAVVRRFARDGARIGLLARGPDGLEGARLDAEVAGGRALVLPTDVADAEQVEVAADTVEERFGPIDVWINNAMTSVFSPVREMQAEEYRRVMDVTYLGSVHGTLAALRRMLPRNQGKVVQVGSALAYRGIPLQSAYCAAKHAVQGFVDSLQSELRRDRSRVSVTTVHLPAVNTPQFEWVKSRLPNKAQPVPPIFQPEVAAEAIHWAAHHQRRELWVGMPVVKAILGNRVAPGLLDRYLASMGYATQQTDEPEDPDRADNLWEPVPGDHGAHGRFDDRAVSHSPQLWAAKHRAGITAGALMLGGAAAAMALMSRHTGMPKPDVEDRWPGPGPRERAGLRALIDRAAK